MESTIVVLHGWGRKIERWQPLKKELEKVGFQVLLPHLPGFGETDPPDEPWGVSDYAQWVKERLPENYFLLGHSFGGRVTIKLASQNPGGLKGLILISSAGIKPRNTIKRFVFLLLAKMGKLFFIIPPFSFFKNFAMKILYKLARERDYYQADGVMKKTLKKVIIEDLKRDLKKIKVPTLILWGEKDSSTPLTNGRLMNQLIPNSSFLVFPDVGHDLPFRLPKKVALAIIKFAKESK